MTERLYVFDTTLRDGGQTTGVEFSLEDKYQIASLIDGLGVDVIEGGYPGANKTDTAFFARPPALRAQLAAFGMTKRAGRSASDDPGVAALLSAEVSTLVFVAKTWDYHVDLALGISQDENLDVIRDTVATARRARREVMLDAEHFFDGYRSNPDFALACLTAAQEAGAAWLVLCDTNGGSLPDDIYAAVAAVREQLPSARIGIHAHDDSGHAVANSLAAVRAGARQIQGTLNGLGERCGNANLTTLIPTLALKAPYAQDFTIGTTAQQLESLTKVSHVFDQLINRSPHRHAPYVGSSAFATKAGIHASALVKDPRTYEHIPPEAVGNTRRILVSEQAGRSNLLAELARLNIEVAHDDPRLAGLLNELKEREALGFTYEGADASFVLLARRMLGDVPHYFTMDGFTINVERRFDAAGHPVTVSQAVVKFILGADSVMSAAEGEGPIHALDLALRKDFGIYQSRIADLHMVDYRVRILHGGSHAVTRVLADFTNADGAQWSTVGVSANIIDASLQALVDAITYKLLITEPVRDLG